MKDTRTMLVNHCPRAVSTLYDYKKASGQPVTDHDLDLLLVRLLEKAELYSRMETGDCR